MKKSGKSISKFLFILILLLTACSSEEESQNNTNETASKESAIDNEMEKRNDKENTMSDIKVKLKFANEEVTVRMENTPTNQDFLSLLPLTLTFEDYAGTEKISYLPRKLSMEGAPNGVEPASGDLTYYAPWGNLAIFYQDFRYSNGLIKLGTIETGIEKLANLNGDFEIVIEKID